MAIMGGEIRFLLNGAPRKVGSLPPTTTVLDYLRGVERACGTKEGCAEGDCGACTVVIGEPSAGSIGWRAINSCITFLPQIDGKALLTVEGLGTMPCTRRSPATSAAAPATGRSSRRRARSPVHPTGSMRLGRRCARR